MNKIISMSIFALLMVGCAAAPETTMTPLQTQAMQSREYTEDKEIVFPAVVLRIIRPEMVVGEEFGGEEFRRIKGLGKRQNFHSLRDIGR